MPISEGDGDVVGPVVLCQDQMFEAAQMNGSVLSEVTMYMVGAEMPADALQLNESPDQKLASPPPPERRSVFQDAAKKKQEWIIFKLSKTLVRYDMVKTYRRSGPLH